MQERLQFKSVKEVLLDLGITDILFDLDDTLIPTRNIFLKKIDAFVAQLKPHLDDPVVFRARFSEINNDLFRKFGVNPNRFEMVVEQLKAESPKDIHSHLDNAKHHLNEIYTTKLGYKDGAKEVLQMLHKDQVKKNLVTHANVAWTDFKLDCLDAWKYFEAVGIIDENGHKTSEEWQRIIDSFCLNPKNCLVIGDNLKGDIIATHKIGIGKAIWLDEGDGWSVYREGELPKGVITISSIKELIPTLLSL